MKLYIVTGEPSGDLHAANLVHEVKKCNPSVNIRAWGGERLISEGVELAKHIKDISFMGLWNVLINLGSIRKNIKYCKLDIINYKPDAIILVDYPGFNLKIAEFAKRNGIKVFYYIAPKLWAWNKSRLNKIRKYVDELLVVFPFEIEFYHKNGISATYLGNPLLDEISKGNFDFTYNSDKPIIALLPGSRKQEVEIIFPEMIKLVDKFPKYQFVVAATTMFSKEYYQSFVDNKNIVFVFNQTYGLLSRAKAALVTSGTATLETALFKVPQVVCYKTNWLTYFLAKRLIKVKFLSLVNILMDKLVVKELIQTDLNSDTLHSSLSIVLNGTSRENTLKDYNKLEKMLGREGASRKIANFILSNI